MVKQIWAPGKNVLLTAFETMSKNLASNAVKLFRAHLSHSSSDL